MQGVRNVSLSEYFAHVLNGRSLIGFHISCYYQNYIKSVAIKFSIFVSFQSKNQEVKKILKVVAFIVNLREFTLGKATKFF